jgi:hypothetical protein
VCAGTVSTHGNGSVKSVLTNGLKYVCIHSKKRKAHKKKKTISFFASSQAKAAALRITLNFDGAPIASKSQTHPAHSQTSRLLTWSLSLGVPVLHTTQCIFLNTILLLTVKHEFFY